MEWTISEHATYALGGATVPLYDTLGPDTVSFVLNQTNLSACICTRSELPNLVGAKKAGNCPSFKTIILVDGVLPESDKLCKEADLEVISLARVESHGAHTLASRPKENPFSPPTGSDICTFCYTSGTTGNPKGALITHSNMISAIAGLNLVFESNMTDRHLSYLPLPHIFERATQAILLLSGASIAFFRGDPTLLIEDIQACRPTIMPVAPRVLAGINSAGGKTLFEAALKAKTDGLKRGH